ncbi:hypothetical protein Tco_0996400 [Tanacetum coccineum]
MTGEAGSEKKRIDSGLQRDSDQEEGYTVGLAQECQWHVDVIHQGVQGLLGVRKITGLQTLVKPHKKTRRLGVNALARATRVSSILWATPGGGVLTSVVCAGKTPRLPGYWAGGHVLSSKAGSETSLVSINDQRRLGWVISSEEPRLVVVLWGRGLGG